MKVGIPREIRPDERRVAATPETVERLIGLGFDVAVEQSAGTAASFPDAAYEEAGAEIVDTDAVWKTDLVIKINPPTDDEVGLLAEGGMLLSMIQPKQNEALVQKLAARKATVFGLDCIPRISRAQAMDVLSSMAAIAGYRAVVEGASEFGRYMSQQFTAAGSTPPANVLVIGAGVAGLAAIATASSMGARVKAFDVREAVKEEIQSLGGEVLELDFEESGEGEGGYAKEMSKEFIEAELALFEEEAKDLDIVITTAMVPGKAPLLFTKKAVENMRPGSVVVDLAAASGGNCEVTSPGEVVEHDGVKVVGYTDLTSRLPAHASQFFGRNVINLLKLMKTEEDFVIDETDDIVRGVLVVRDGEVMWPPPRIEPTTPAKKESEPAPAPAPKPIPDDKPRRKAGTASKIAAVLGLIVAGLIGVYAPADFVQHFTVFVLACFVGWQVIWNVNPALHTPLMSVTNAISGIIVVGGILQAVSGASTLVLILAVTAILVASINIFGGFLVTQRMLKMFRGGGDA
jgi:NAD(P) transhydrogenase subunit alpha